GQLMNILKQFYRNFDEGTFKHYTNKFKIREELKIRNFSTGEKMKLSLTIALSHRAELLVLDEPTSNLDPNFRIEFLEILQDLMVDENMTILFSTHITSDLESIAEYIILIDDADIVFHEEKDVLLEKYKNIKVVEDIQDDETRSLFKRIMVTSVGFEDNSTEHQALTELYDSNVMVDQLKIDQRM